MSAAASQNIRARLLPAPPSTARCYVKVDGETLAIASSAATRRALEEKVRAALSLSSARARVRLIHSRKHRANAPLSLLAHKQRRLFSTFAVETISNISAGNTCARPSQILLIEQTAFASCSRLNGAKRRTERRAPRANVGQRSIRRLDRGQRGTRRRLCADAAAVDAKRSRGCAASVDSKSKKHAVCLRF